MAEGKKTGGRQKGVPNKRTAAREMILAKVKISPLEYMLSVLDDEDADPQDRRWAAKEAAPYVHAKLAAIELANKAGEVFRVVLGNSDGGIL